MKNQLLIIVLLQFICICGAMITFLRQPDNVTVVKVGEVALIHCKLSRDIRSNRNWYINNSFSVENNLPIGMYAVENGLYISGEYSKYYNQTGFQCSYSVNTGPPNFFMTFKSYLGILRVDANNKTTTTGPPKHDALQAVASAPGGSFAKMTRIIILILITAVMLALL